MKKFLYRFIKFSLILIVSAHVFVWFYEKPQREAYENGTSIKLNKWNAIQNESNQYDVVILGSSRGYSAYNPIIIDSITNMNSYNMCTGSQHIIESMYMLKEILKHQKPSYLVCDLYLSSFRTNPDFYHLFSNAKFMSNDMIVDEFLDQKILDIVFPIYKYKEYIKRDFSSLNFFKTTPKQQPNLWVKGYKPSSRSTDVATIDNFPPLLSFSTVNTISESNIESYLKEIIQLCKEHDIQPIFMRAPFPPSRIEKSEIDEAHEYFNDFFNTQKLTFYDLNYISTTTYTDYDFEDDHHLNSRGAKKASVALSKLIQSKE